MQEKLVIFDTTLRDGEQSPGVALTASEKAEIAKGLSRMGVDVCEAGFPVCSEGDFEAVSKIAKEVGPSMEGREELGKSMVIAGLSRAKKEDIQRTFDAVKWAPLHRIHTFLATSDIHLKYKLRIDRRECVRRVVEAVKFASSLCHDVEFSAEDAGRTDRDFLVEVAEEAIKAGATTINLPDTVGICTPEEYGAMFKYVIARTSAAEKVTWSAHCQNDLGLATANTLAAIGNGVRQVEVTINGIGERAGNTSLEEVVMALYLHPQQYSVTNHINPGHIYRMSQLVQLTTGMQVQPHKAIVGQNAFAHESGIHQDGILKHNSTYEIIAPEVVGVPSNSLPLGKSSGRNALKAKVEELGYSIDEDALQKLFVRFKKLADEKKTITNNDLVALIEDHTVSTSTEAYQIKHISLMACTSTISTATITLYDKTKLDAEPIVDAATGHGPVQAIFACINRLVNCQIYLRDYEVRAIGVGSDALGKVFVKISTESEAENKGLGERTYPGTATDNDVMYASAKAYLNALNKMLISEKPK